MFQGAGHPTSAPWYNTSESSLPAIPAAITRRARTSHPLAAALGPPRTRLRRGGRPSTFYLPVSTIFISYASQDRETARALARFLEAEGHSVWWDRTIPPGRVFDEVIQEALVAAGCVVVLWSSHSVRSNWVKVEAEEGVARGLLVPVLIEAVAPPIQFKRIQAANLTAWRGDTSDPELRTLLAAIERLLGQPPAAAPQPVARPAPAGLSHTVRTVGWSVVTTLALVATVLLISRMGTEDTPAGPAARNAQPPAAGETRADPAPADPGASVSPASDDRQASGSTNDAPGQGGELLNLLSPRNGGELITADNALWASSVDGDESTNLWVNASATSEAVFAFKDGRPATIEAVEILVAGTHPNNVSELEVLTGNDAPDGRFERLQVFTPRNILIVKERYQRFVFPPRTARYIKARVLKAHGGFTKVLAEWRVLGRLP